MLTVRLVKPTVLPQYNVAKDLKDVKVEGELFKEFTFRKPKIRTDTFRS